MSPDDKEDAEMFRWLIAQARTEGRDGGYVVFYHLPFIEKEGVYPKPVMHKDIRTAIRAAMGGKKK